MEDDEKGPASQVHRIELYVTEVNNRFGIEDVKLQIENSLDDNVVSFGVCETKDSGEWDDDHFLNCRQSPEKLRAYFDSLPLVKGRKKKP